MRIKVFLLSEKWVPVILAQPETGMGYSVVTLILRDGSRVPHVTVVGGYVTKVGESTDIWFSEADVVDIIVTGRPEK